jgi:transcriptional regulator with XRE-family HTH domain
VEDRQALGEYLRSRRARVRPEDVGLPPGTGRRQTPGLRREELAALAGLSVDYYTRLEQGRDTNPGVSVLGALARALRLNQDERAHLFALVGAVPGPASPPQTARPGLLRLLEALRPAPAYLLTQASDVLAANPEGWLLMPGLPGSGNLVRYVFTEPAARDVFVDWPQMAEDCVAHLRTIEANEAKELVAELGAVSEAFRRLWATYDVRVKRGARRPFHHPVVGRFTLTSEILTAVDGQRLAVFQAEPSTPDHDAIVLLSLTAGAR